ncbi:MAG: class I mannose-6-phosphate isomerase [Spirochaetaceae bacterium]|jgi:mannose-6-phosphate isomerase|nr:class I mannose-6-phosphate isomerase [Spirochaetaceae bacterium]
MGDSKTTKKTDLYPLEFIPIPKKRIWGGNKLKQDWNKDFLEESIGESWELSGQAENVSRVKNGPLKGKLLTELIDLYGTELLGEKPRVKNKNDFPLLFKFIDARDDLSVQVHPDDVAAKQRHGCAGKTEMWFVADAEPRSKLFAGFSRQTNAAEYRDLVLNGRLEEVLQKEVVKKGDAFFIPSGTVHGIGAGVLVAEIQQSSDITYRIYDYNRKDENGVKRELHIEQSFDVVNFENAASCKINYKEIEDGVAAIAVCPYFTVNFIKPVSLVKRDLTKTGAFAVYMCIDGEAVLNACGKTAPLKKGSTILVPAILNSNISITGRCSVLETSL